MDKEQFNDQSEVPTFSDVSSLLNSIVERTTKLQTDARRKLHELEDRDGYREAVYERARLIKDLPKILDDFEKAGGFVPEKVKGFAAYNSIQAKDMIEQDNMFGMNVLFHQQGSNVKDPNDLEQLVESLQPSDSK